MMGNNNPMMGNNNPMMNQMMQQLMQQQMMQQQMMQKQMNNKMNPMNNNNYMNQNNTMEGFNNAGAMSDNELKSNLNKLLTERNQIDSSLNKNNTKFNPMNSPNMNINMNNSMDVNQMLMYQKMQEMMSGNNLNFRRGGVVGQSDNDIYLYNNMDIKDLENYIEKIKKQLLRSQVDFPTFNVQFLQTLEPTQLDKIIDKINNCIISSNDLEEFLNESTNPNYNIYNSKKNESINLYKSNTSEQMHNEINTVENHENHLDLLNESELILNNNNKNKMITVTEILEPPIEIKNIEEKEEKEVKKNNIELIIKSEEYADKEYYNDILVELKEPITNINTFELIGYEFSNKEKGKFYLFIENIEDKQPFCEIDLNRNIEEISPTIKKFNPPLPVLKEFYIKLKRDDKYEEDNLYKLESEEPYKLYVKIT